MQGELGSDPCAHVFFVKLSETESKFKYKDGFFVDSGCKQTQEHKSMIETEGKAQTQLKIQTLTLTGDEEPIFSMYSIS